MNKTPKTLNWRFDVSTFKLLGRELITDRITAIFELVKNCYDANAENVTIEFYNVRNLSEDSRITIKDDGVGMSYDEITNNWMVIGTSSKRKKTVSEPPYNRTFIGEKGIGRFAVEKLGSKLLLRTKKEGQRYYNILGVDWDAYEKLSQSQLELFNQNQTKYFTDIENTFRTEETNEHDKKGTELIISCAREIWTEYDIDRAYKELSKLISPFGTSKYPFNIYILSDEYKAYSRKKVENISVKNFATSSFFLDYDLNTEKQEVIKHENGKLIKIKSDKRSFGYIKFQLYYFDLNAIRRFKGIYKNTPFENFIDGVKIYRDGIITTPFAEDEAEQMKKRDILGIDKRKYSDIFLKVSTRNLLGILEITKEFNPQIIDATNRQDFVNNEEYKDLKIFIIEQIYELEKYLKYQKDEIQKKSGLELKSAQDDIGTFTQQIREIEAKHPAIKEDPSIKKDLEVLKKQARQAQISIKKGIKAQNELKKEITRKENLYLSMLSLQEFAAEFAHVIRTAIWKAKDRADFFVKKFPDEKYNDLFKTYSHEIAKQMRNLIKAADHMLSFSKSDLEPEELDIKKVIEEIFEHYQDYFERNHIRSVVEIKDAVLLTFNRQLFEDIFANLISNSSKALKDTENKIIKCTGLAENDRFIVYFSDNGHGIRNEHAEKIFEVYFTTTAEDGGSGFGLWIVKNRLKSLRGKIELIESEFKPKGATFKIMLPFKKDKL